MTDAPETLAIVEDSDEDFAMFERVFASRGPILRWSDAEAALAAFREGDPRLDSLSALVVDLNLPGMDGIALVEAARALPGGASPVICMLSSSERPSDIRRAELVGADGYLVKPDSVAGLRALPSQLAEIAAQR